MFTKIQTMVKRLIEQTVISMWLNSSTRLVIDLLREIKENRRSSLNMYLKK
jgi:hypothetical protein